MNDQDQLPRGTVERLRVFVSYSRRDSLEADHVVEALRNQEFEVTRDTSDILPTEEWRSRLDQLILECDAVVFLLSPHSASSEICVWEVELAEKLNKKIIPIVIKDVDGSKIPENFSQLNYIIATKKERLENAICSLGDIISTDIEWIREHTRIMSLATGWLRNEKSPDRLLRGEQLHLAHAWVAREPKDASLSPLCRSFLGASERVEAEVAEYFSVRLKALTEYVKPLLISEMKKVSESYTRILGDSVHYLMADGGKGSHNVYLDGQYKVSYISNFLEDDGKWHPVAAELVNDSSDEHDGNALWRFPCCGWEEISSFSPPNQYRADGCKGNPLSPLQSKDEFSGHGVLNENSEGDLECAEESSVDGRLNEDTRDTAARK